MKRFIASKGGLNGRLKAVAKLLSLPGYVAKTTRLTGDELRAIPVHTSVSRERFKAVTSTDDEWIAARVIAFDVAFE